MPQDDLNPAARDALSNLGAELFAFNQPSAYSDLVVAGEGNIAAKAKLELATPAALLKSGRSQPVMAQLVLGGLWLWHDWLDESHRISQQIETPDGSYWHAIMHRREGDFSNSKYWLARCRAHPVGSHISAKLPALIEGHENDRAVIRITTGGWDPFAFVDLAEEVHHRREDARRATIVAIQKLEWQALFEHCLIQAG